MSKVKLKGKLFERKRCDKCIRPLNVLICLTQPFLLNELYIFHYNQWEREDPTATQKEWMYKEHGFPNEETLVKDFRKWLRGRNILCMYANNPTKEISLLNYPTIYDIHFPKWQHRISLVSHQTALHFKRLSIPITCLNSYKSCSKEAHSEFKFVPTPRHSPTELAKKDFGYHCALYDCYALYLYYLSDS